ADRRSYASERLLADGPHFPLGPTFLLMHYSHNDVSVYTRYHPCVGFRFWESLQEDPVLDDLHALVEFAQAGSIAGAADHLFRTPSAITRQLQRLEAELGAELLDR